MTMTSTRRRVARFALLLTCALGTVGGAQTGYHPTVANLSARLPRLPAKVTSARFLGTGRAADFTEHDFGVVLKVPLDGVDPVDTIVALDLEPKS